MEKLLSESTIIHICDCSLPYGHYRTKAMILAYYNALAAGDTTTDVAV